MMQHRASSQGRHLAAQPLSNNPSAYGYKTQEEMWSEFNKHFQNPNRNVGKTLNHHDFLDAQFIKGGESSRRSFFQKMGGNSLGPHVYQSQDVAQMGNTVDLGFNR